MDLQPDDEKGGRVWIIRLLESQGVQIVGWVFAAGILYGIYIQFPILVDRIDRGYQAATTRFTASQEKFAEDVLESNRLRSQDLQTTLKAFREDEREDRRLMVEILRRSDIDADELSEAIEAAATRDNGTPPEPPPN